MTSWPLSVLLTGGLGCLVLGVLAVLVGGLLAVRQVGSTRSGTVKGVREVIRP
ncbi:hypothetical protein [Actinopolymorpha pittospori]|uniref:Uncharacterized protein n=1 Tax=Actinopolymorpha pittospori TaxID=648752 RepID=A0A927N645_9ACTN|nr:hypothetical protein [Actinopolymorpha pittospori]MBE1613136.1 hypothetical protein [Actinopolymorpha pittospori]